MYFFSSFKSNFVASFVVFGILNSGSVGGNSMFVRLLSSMFGDKMSKSGECSFDIARHGEADFLLLVVPFECDAKILISFPASSVS